jgi:micrococcal nuclease
MKPLLARILLITVALIVCSMPHPPSVAANQNPAPIEQADKQERAVYITKTGERYHRGSCHHLRRSKIAIKLKDAFAQGHTPCKVCRP